VTSVDTGVPAVNPHVVPQCPVRPASVYRYYDKYGLLVYVGISIRGPVRNVQHRHSAFWPYVVSQEIDHLPDEVAARARERDLIQRYKPPFNVQHNPGHEQARAVYLAFRESAMDKAAPIDLWRAFGRGIPLQVARVDTPDTFMIQFQSSPAAAPIVNRLELSKKPRPYSDKGNCIGQCNTLAVDRGLIFGRAVLRAGEYAGAYLKCRFANKSGRFNAVRLIIVTAA